MSDNLTERLICHEGLCLLPYHDSLGFKTVGCGHRITPADGDKYDKGITREQAMALLDDDILKAKMAVAKAFPWSYTLDDARKDVIYEMVFQMGIAGVRKFSRFLNAVQIQDWGAAAHEMRNSAWHEQTPNRCEELAQIILHGTETA